jgi:hypothetical protein
MKNVQFNILIGLLFLVTPKVMALLDSETLPLTKQPVRQGLPVSILAKAIAAATYTSLPDMFHQFENGYDLYLQLLQRSDFQHLPIQRTQWIYQSAIKAAIRAKDKPQARQWLQQVQAVRPDTSIINEMHLLVNQMK